MGHGTGLGLPVSRSIVESFGGTLDLAPTVEGQGARFVLSLPGAAGNEADDASADRVGTGASP